MAQAKKSSSATKSKSSSSKSTSSASTSAENVVKMSSAAVKDIVANGAQDVQKAREQVFAITRESSEHFVKTADTASKALYETIAICRDNMEALVECGNLTAAFAKDMSNELVESSNQAFSDNLEMTKEFFACRTLNDMLDLQNRMFKSSMDNFFTQSMNLSNMMFEYTTEALEPINERMTEASEKLSKTLAS